MAHFLMFKSGYRLRFNENNWVTKQKRIFPHGFSGLVFICILIRCCFFSISFANLSPPILSVLPFFTFSGVILSRFVGVTVKGCWCDTKASLVSHQRALGKEAKIGCFHSFDIQLFIKSSVRISFWGAQKLCKGYTLVCKDYTVLCKGYTVIFVIIISMVCL